MGPSDFAGGGTGGAGTAWSALVHVVSLLLDAACRSHGRRVQCVPRRAARLRTLPFAWLLTPAAVENATAAPISPPTPTASRESVPGSGTVTGSIPTPATAAPALCVNHLPFAHTVSCFSSVASTTFPFVDRTVDRTERREEVRRRWSN